MDQVQTIITNIRTLYASQRTYSSISAEQAQAMGILTEESIDGSQGLNPFGGKILFGATDSGRTFTVTYTGLTSEACVKMATADWGADQSSGLRGIGVGTGDAAVAPNFGWKDETVDTYKPADAAHYLPVQVPQAASSCGTTQNGAVTWYYR